jgi:1-acyl-sn-glycerol-3-phosphate acyltransferase
MFKSINYYWRILGTGISFTAFGLGGLLIRILIFPLLIIVIPKPQLRLKIARTIIQLVFRFLIDFAQFLGVLRYDIRGLTQLKRKGLLVLANHPTLIDTVFLMAFVQQANCIVKSALWHNPFTSGPVRAAGYIRNETGPGLVENCITTLQQGSNLIIFPEGTRTAQYNTMTFKRGAANIAVRGQCDITPIVIHCRPLAFKKGEKWWRVPPVIPHFTLEVQQDIKIEDFINNADNEALAARQLTKYLQHYFMKEIQHAAT